MICICHPELSLSLLYAIINVGNLQRGNCVHHVRCLCIADYKFQQHRFTGSICLTECLHRTILNIKPHTANWSFTLFHWTSYYQLPIFWSALCLDQPCICSQSCTISVLRVWGRNLNLLITGIYGPPIWIAHPSLIILGWNLSKKVLDFFPCHQECSVLLLTHSHHSCSTAPHQPASLTLALAKSSC